MSSPTTAQRPVPAPRPAPAPSAASGGVAIDPVKIVKQYKWWLLGAVCVGGMVGIAAYFALLYTSPLYRSTVVYQGLPPIQDPKQPEAAFVDREEFERNMLTQSLLMSSERTLRAAIQSSGPQLAKDTSWAKSFLDNDQKIREADAVRSLKKMISSNVRTGTSLIELSCTTGRREDAAIIVNAVHGAFWTDYGRQNTLASSQTVGPLSQNLQEYRNELSRLDTTMASIRKEQTMTNLDPRETKEAEEVRSLQGPIAEATGRLEMSKSTLKRLEDMIKNDSVTISDEIKDMVDRDPVIAELKSRIAGLTAEIDRMKLTGFGENHKSLMEMKNRLEASSKELEHQRDTLAKKLFAAEVDRQRRMVESTEAELREYKSRLDIAGKKLQEITEASARLKGLELEHSRIQERIEETRKEIDTLNLALSLSKSDRINRLRKLEDGKMPDAPYFPQLFIMLPLGMLAVLALTGGVIFLRELFDQRVKGPSDVAMIPRVRLLGIIPLATEDTSRPGQVETAFRDSPTGAISEAFRHVRAPIVKRMHQAGYKSLLVVSGMPEAGATSVVANLAMGSAASELRVLMIDANFRRPALHRVFKLGEGPGLGDVLARKVTLEAAVQATTMPNLHLLAAGSGATRTLPERLGTDAMSQLLKEAGEKYDLIFIDTAPAIVAGDALSVANRVDSCILIVKANSDKRGMVARIRDQFSDVHAEFMGVVVNAVKASAGGYMRKNLKAAQEYQSSTPTV